MLQSSPLIRATTRERGFTFVEILAAMLFMALVIPVTFEGVTLANRVGSAAARRRVAVQLADRMLNEAIVTESWRTGDQSGDFTETHPGFRWELTVTDWDEDTQQVITLRVYYKVQEQEQSAELSTLAPAEEAAATAT